MSSTEKTQNFFCSSFERKEDLSLIEPRIETRLVLIWDKKSPKNFLKWTAKTMLIVFHCKMNAQTKTGPAIVAQLLRSNPVPNICVKDIFADENTDL